MPLPPRPAPGSPDAGAGHAGHQASHTRKDTDITPDTTKPPTRAQRLALTGALADDEGRLPADTNSRVLASLKTLGWITSPPGADPQDATGHRINSAGRRALFTATQWKALQEATAEGQLPAATPWPAVQALQGAGFAEYRDAEGRVQPHDHGGRNSAYLTHLGLRARPVPPDPADSGC